MDGLCPVSVVIIAQDEEPNIARAVRSCIWWVQDVFVVDGGSKDKTAEIAREAGAQVCEHPFTHWADQRNWALEHLPVRTDWVLFLDADEYPTEAFKSDMLKLLSQVDGEVGAVRARFHCYFLGKHAPHAIPHPPAVRLVRRGSVRWLAVGAREYPEYRGEAPTISAPLMHNDLKGLGAWISRQNSNADCEARVLLRERSGQAAKFARQKDAHRPRWHRLRALYNKLPPFIRPFLYFAYRYIVCGGFLDGKEGFVYVFFHALWYRMLIDAKYLEMRKRE